MYFRSSCVIEPNYTQTCQFHSLHTTDRGVSESGYSVSGRIPPNFICTPTTHSLVRPKVKAVDAKGTFPSLSSLMCLCMSRWLVVGYFTTGELNFPGWRDKLSAFPFFPFLNGQTFLAVLPYLKFCVGMHVLPGRKSIDPL